MKMKNKCWKRVQRNTNPQFSGKCVCGNDLEVAYNPDINVKFWNCFECFPMHVRADRTQKMEFEELFGMNDG